MSTPPARIRPGHEIAAALGTIPRAPFMGLYLLEVFVALVNVSVALRTGPGSDSSSLALAQVSTIVFVVLSTYIQIAVILAAGGEGGSAEAFIRAAFKRRCFWRYFGTTLLVGVLVAIAALAVVVGAFFAGAALAVALPAVVLEGKKVGDALGRSVELTRGARVPVGIVFGALFLLPIAIEAVLQNVFDLGLALQSLVTLGGTTLLFCSLIASARIFVQLGGAPSPPVQALLYKGARPGPR